MKSENLQAVGIVLLVTVIVGCIVAIAYENDMKRIARDNEVKEWKQILIKTGNAWYNPTNGNFEVITKTDK